jgi:hypothetical protein
MREGQHTQNKHRAVNGALRSQQGGRLILMLIWQGVAMLWQGVKLYAGIPWEHNNQLVSSVTRQRFAPTRYLAYLN